MDAAEADLHLVVDPLCLTNPFTFPVGLSENAVTNCYKMLDRASDEDEEIGVEIGTLGIFNSSSVGIWKRACYAASLHWKLKAKLNWLEENATHLTSAAYQSIKRVLTTSRPKEWLFERNPIFMDVEDYASLAGERWLTGSVIDTICLQLMSEQRHHHCIFLPSLAQQWASTSDANFLTTKLEQFIVSNGTDTARWLLTPIHLSNHWGLLCFDYETKEAYFDEGLNM